MSDVLVYVPMLLVDTVDASQTRAVMWVAEEDDTRKRYVSLDDYQELLDKYNQILENGYE